MRRLFASFLLFLASVGLVLSPAAACQMNVAQPTVARDAAMACHEKAEIPAKPAPDKNNMKGCCTSMCAPAVVIVGPVLAESRAPILAADAPRPACLVGVTPSLDKPPPRILA